jgi:hypothetical protein
LVAKESVFWKSLLIDNGSRHENREENPVSTQGHKCPKQRLQVKWGSRVQRLSTNRSRNRANPPRNLRLWNSAPPAFPIVQTGVRIAIRRKPVESLEHASNAELLSKLAGKPVAEVLMHQYGGLTNLAQASFDELQLVKGIGQSKAAAIKSAFLLAQRLTREAYSEQPIMDEPSRIADFLREENRPYTVENFQIVFLNTRRRLIGVQNISQGTLDSVHVHPREVFASALAKRASAIVLVHNLCVAAHKLCYVQSGVMWSTQTKVMV